MSNRRRTEHGGGLVIILFSEGETYNFKAETAVNYSHFIDAEKKSTKNYFYDKVIEKI